MANTYEWGDNLFADYLQQLINLEIDISDEKVFNNISSVFETILKNYLYDEKDVLYLDFKITKTEIGYKVIGNNLISALWLSGYFPDDIELVVNDNEFIIEDVKFTFDKIKCELIESVIDKI